jgi:biopolymer transport protein ExbD
MARRKKKVKLDEKIDLNMTPMLDVVFNLIIFFMIVTDMTQQELEQLTLPKASEAVKDEGENIKKRMIINIEKDGTIKIKRNEYTLDTLQKRLYEFAEQHRVKEGPEKGLCDEPILIRADYNTDFEHIQAVMQRCADQKIQIWKIQLAAAQTDEDKA